MFRRPFRRSCLFIVLAVSCVGPAAAKPASWEADIARFEQADARNSVAPGAVLFVGSSSIRLWTTLAADFPGLAVINRGFGGSELADSVHFADRIVLPYRPRVVVLYAGDNDITAGKPPARVLADFQAFRTRLHAVLPQTQILFMAIKECPGRAGKRGLVREANMLIAADCATQEHCTFVDVAAPLLSAEGGFLPEMFESDGIHLTAAGYAAWVKVLRPQLERALPVRL